MTRSLARHRPSPAFVVALIALFMSLGGVGYAAVKINGKSIRNNSIPAKKLKTKSIPAKKLRDGAVTAAKVRKDALGGAQVNESALGQVPSAADAQALDGKPAAAYAEGSVSISGGFTAIPVNGDIHVLETAVGNFDLECQNGISSADARYRNTGLDAAQVWRSYVIDDTAANTLVDTAGSGGDYGLAFDDPIRGVIDARKGNAFAELEYFSVEAGGECSFRWELTQGTL